MGLTSQGM